MNDELSVEFARARHKMRDAIWRGDIKTAVQLGEIMVRFSTERHELALDSSVRSLQAMLDYNGRF